MDENKESDSPGSGASFMQTTEDVARAFAAATTTASVARSARPSVVYSSKDDSSGPLHKLQDCVSGILKGLSSPPEVKTGSYNPEILTSQKRQWANFQLQSLVKLLLAVLNDDEISLDNMDQRVWKEPSKLLESMVVVGLHPNCDIPALQNLYFARKFEGSGRFRSAFGGQHQSRVEPSLEPQVLFVYPPEKQLPLNYKDLLSFCFPAGVEVNAVERTPSMSELNEILLGQEHLKQSDLSFVFRLQVADDSSLYGCCVLVEEIIHKPSGLISMVSDRQSSPSILSRHILTTRRCYCILSRLPFFELHFGVLNSILTEERLEQLTKQISSIDLESSVGYDEVEILEEKSGGILLEDGAVNVLNGIVGASPLSTTNSISGRVSDDISHLDHENLEINIYSKKELDNIIVPLHPGTEKLVSSREFEVDTSADNNFTNEVSADKCLTTAVLPLLRYQQCETSESFSSFQGSPSEDRRFRSDVDETETEEASSSGQDIFSEHSDILEGGKTNKHGSLRILYEYYQLRCPTHGSTIKFHPLVHLHPLEYYRPDEIVLCIAGSKVVLGSCKTSLELAEVHSALLVEEEATALSVWAVACLCGSLRLEHVLTLVAGVLLEKQIVVVCSNLGILCALVLSIIPLIRPYQWQSLLMPILPNDMLDFLDAPVPYIVGVKSEVQSKLTNIILVDANKNQVKAPTMPQLPRHQELYSCLSPYHTKLVGESYLGKKRPVYECTDEQVDAAKGFIGVLRSYLDSLCFNLLSHTITNVQSNDDKVSLLLKESFIESFPGRDQPFMKLFGDTQLFSVHTDFVHSFFQKE